MICTSKNLEKLQYISNQELIKLKCWCDSNELVINPAKSFILINPTSKLSNNTFILNYNSEPITRNQVVKYLGVSIDESLSWKNHIINLEKN